MIVYPASEEWRPCFGGFYAVSDMGRVRRERKGPGTRPGRILKATSGSNRYLTVDLYGNGEHRMMLVHRLVAKAFLPHDPERLEVNHKNGIRHDNRVENLEWVTCSENHRHAFRSGLRTPTRGEQCPQHVLNEATVKLIRERRSRGETTIAISTSLGIRPTTVYAVTQRRTWRHVT